MGQRRFSPAKIFTWLDNLIGKIEAQVLAWGIMIMAVNTIANVFGRYFFNQSIYFTEELNQFLIVIITFMGLGFVTRKGRHIRMSAFYDMLSPRPKKLLMILIALVTAVAMFVLAWYAFEYVAKIARRGRVTPALQVPLYLTYIWVVVGFIVTGIQYLLCMVKNFDLDDEEVYISYTEIDCYEDPEIAEVMHLYNQDHPPTDATVPDDNPASTTVSNDDQEARS
ncbi:TRAP transporter small permease [Motiliproteus coralliicola]|uniref:TRAP transporter small permease protein n=2 Tax=Motiliproteus coralliicola TaxID=2283196 RepID=A0A369WW59_9GAMM|nr:TRAP transporter small permease [Motiliproteus coralliicola]